MSKPTHSSAPTLTLEDKMLRYADIWSLPLRDVRLIGEYTTAAGPAGQDYFIVFVDANGASYDAPAVALEERTAHKLRQRFHSLTFRLLNNTGEASRIVWPPQAADKALYTYRSMPARTWTDRFQRLFGTRNVEIDLSPAATAVIDRAHDDPPANYRDQVTITMVGSSTTPKLGRHASMGAAAGNHRRGQ